jgi:hypothetical protein
VESNERMQVVQQLCKVHGVGAAIANQWYTRGIRTIEGALDAGLMNEQQQLGARRRACLLPFLSLPSAPLPSTPSFFPSSPHSSPRPLLTPSSLPANSLGHTWLH